MIASGCDRDPMVRVYEAPKDPEIVRPIPPRMAAKLEGPTRFLIAMVPIDGQVYFIKAQARPEKLDGMLEGLRQIASNMKPADTGEIDWALPEGWTKSPGTGIAMAVLQAPSDDEPVSFAVTKLAGPSSEVTWDSYLEDNITRWRAQLSLPENDFAEQKKSLIRIDRKGTVVPAWIVDLRTEAIENTATDASPQPSKPSLDSPPKQIDLKFDTPDGWNPGASNSIRIASFNIVEGDATAEVTVIIAGGDRLSNIARWQGQLSNDVSSEQITELTKQVIEKALKVTTAHGVEGTLYSLVGPEGDSQRATLAAILPLKDNDSSLFVKLSGPAKVAEAHRERLTQFISSMKW